MLCAQWHGETGTPVVFLHGLLGDKMDWQAVFFLLTNSQACLFTPSESLAGPTFKTRCVLWENFAKKRPLTVDLPCHGASQHIACRDFAHARELLHQTISHHIGNQPFYLVGYSLGGRLALDYALNAQNPFLKHTFLEGANIGLATDAERQARWQNDQRWANRFRHEPIEMVLNDWYQQPVFAALTDSARAMLIDTRRHNNGSTIAQMLEATSLAKQPNFLPRLKNSFSELVEREDLTFLIGSHDQKFRQMVEIHSLPHVLVPNAGHNAHRDNPQAFAHALLERMSI